MPKKPTTSNPFYGQWNIVSMTVWEKGFFNEEQQAFIEFDDKGRGEFHFGYVHGVMICSPTTKDGAPAVEWTWEGNDEMDEVHGRGWAILNGNELQGMISLHQEESGFVAEKSKRKLRR